MKYLTKHFEDCSAPICSCTLDEKAIWYVGEEICSRRPLQKFQRVQKKLNRLADEGKISPSKVFRLADLNKSRLVQK